MHGYEPTTKTVSKTLRGKIKICKQTTFIIKTCLFFERRHWYIEVYLAGGRPPGPPLASGGPPGALAGQD